jgi:DNA-binding sugar fermentation-stimulating protein
MLIEMEVKKKLWEKVCNEFPDDPMLRDLHFIRELMDIVEVKSKTPIEHKELSKVVRKEFKEWLDAHPEFKS